MEHAANELLAVARSLGDAPEATIFVAQAAMATDPTLLAGATPMIEAGADAATAIQRGAADIAEQLAALNDEVLSARAADVRDVGTRIASLLSGGPPPSVELTEPSIVLADDLAPSLAATISRELLRGICLSGGSVTAHAAILARSWGVPAVVGVDRLEAVAASAQAVAINGTTGDVFADPDEAATAALQYEFLRGVVDSGPTHGPARTRDGCEIALLANIGDPSESETAHAAGAQGVGLFRTEFAFLGRREGPTEDEQQQAYEEVINAFAPDPVTIRLLDVGGDKPVAYLPIDREANPFLGVRGWRIAERHPDVYASQLRAIARAARGTRSGQVKVMAPMVTDAVDVDLLRRLARTAGTPEAGVATGVMLETPASILTAASYFRDIDFASIGTNDLAQYTLAADRGNAQLVRFHDAFHPAVLKLIAAAVQAAAASRIELSVCGELAGDPLGALALVGLGIRRLSMAASSLPAVRHGLAQVSLADLERAATAALDDRTAAEARDRFAGVRG